MKNQNIIWFKGIPSVLLSLLFFATPFFLFFLFPDNHYYYEMLPWVITTVLIFLLSILGAFTLLRYQAEKHDFLKHTAEFERNERNDRETNDRLRYEENKNYKQVLDLYGKVTDSTKELTKVISEMKNMASTEQVENIHKYLQFQKDIFYDILDHLNKSKN